MAGTLYPVPTEAPYNYLPYLYLAYLIAGLTYFALTPKPQPA
jgi:hypothetical protein